MLSTFTSITFLSRVIILHRRCMTIIINIVMRLPLPLPLLIISIMIIDIIMIRLLLIIILLNRSIRTIILRLM